MFDAMNFMERLCYKKGDRKLVVLCGDGWGDNGKRAVESAITGYFEACVRVSGGANTGGTRKVRVGDTESEFILHLIPSLWLDNIKSIMGDWVLIDLKRFVEEKRGVINLIGEPTAPLYISKRAPVFLPYHAMLESWIEYSKGAQAVGTTKRGIGPMIAGIDLRIGPQVGHLLDPNVFHRWVYGFYKAIKPILFQLVSVFDGTASEIRLNDFNPEIIADELLALVPEIKDHVVDVDPLLQELARNNKPTLFGMTQGYGLHSRGTYPFCSSTQITAQGAAYCSGIPMDRFGPVILVSKLWPTRVGWGPFPTGWWDRLSAEQFPLKHPELFSVLPEYEPKKRSAFLADKRRLINTGRDRAYDRALYFMVLLNNLGATTKRGREVGYPDLHMTACAAQSNGADCIALTQIDTLSGLDFELPLAVEYELDGKKVDTSVVPMTEEMKRVVTVDQLLRIDLKNDDLSKISTPDDLPGCIKELLGRYLTHTGTPVGIASLSPGADGKLFFDLS